MKKVIIKHDNYQLRDYQLKIAHALETHNYKKLLLILPRRSGKDFLAWQLIIRAALDTVGVYVYCLPTYRQCKNVIWNSITTDGIKFLDFIPKDAVLSMNSQDMTIKLVNGSMIQLIGSNRYDSSLVGSNPRFIVFSEYSLSDPRAYAYSKPILTANKGVAIFLSTPRGKNHLFDLWKIASKQKDWFCMMKTVEETKHIDVDLIKAEIASGEISEDLALQEYYCSFDMGVEGAYYTKLIDKLRLDERIGNVDWDPSYKVHSCMDLGFSDSTSIVWFQVIGTNVHVIDAYENSKQSLVHYIEVLNSKPWARNYGKHIAPPDIAVHEYTSGVARIDKARELGIHYTIAQKLSIEDGIEAVRCALPRMYIDERKCGGLIKALENYRQEYDAIKKVYKSQPLHDWSSHYADCMRYLAISLPRLQTSMTKADLDRMRAAAYDSNKSFGNFGHPTDEEYNRMGGQQW